MEWMLMFLLLQNSSIEAPSFNGIVLADNTIKTGNWVMQVDLINGLINRTTFWMRRGPNTHYLWMRKKAFIKKLTIILKLQPQNYEKSFFIVEVTQFKFSLAAWDDFNSLWIAFLITVLKHLT